MIWRREEYIAHMNFQFTGKEMFCELFGTLIGLDEEWRTQGATEDEINLTAFDWDYVLKKSINAKFGAVTDITPRIIEDNREYQVKIDNLGRKTKLCKGMATIPLPLDYPIKNMDDWLKFKKYYEFNEERVDLEYLKEIKSKQEQGHLIIGGMLGGFDEPRQLLGEEELCVAYYEQPELIKDILDTISDTAVKIYERVFEVIKIDCLSVHEDLAGKSGPLIGPNQINEFVKPYYRKVWDFASANGCTIFSQDSDGNMNSVIDEFLDCGVNCMYPCEPAAGMDIAFTTVFILLIATFLGCQKKPNEGADEDKKLTYFAALTPQAAGATVKNLAETPLYKKMKEITGVDVEFIHPAVGQEKEQINLLIASKDLPDIVEYTWSAYPGGVQKAIDDGVIISLSPYMDNVAVNLKKVLTEDKKYKYDKLVKTDQGNYYMFPFLAGDDSLVTFQGPVIRKDWLDTRIYGKLLKKAHKVNIHFFKYLWQKPNPILNYTIV